MTCASNLRERITFQAESGAADGYGGKADAWTNISTSPTVSADVAPVRGSESVDAGRLAGKATYLITIRYRTDITTGNRVLWDDIILNIRSPLQNRDKLRKFMTFEAQEGVTQ